MYSEHWPSKQAATWSGKLTACLEGFYCDAEREYGETSWWATETERARERIAVLVMGCSFCDSGQKQSHARTSGDAVYFQSGEQTPPSIHPSIPQLLLLHCSSLMITGRSTVLHQTVPWLPPIIVSSALSAHVTVCLTPSSLSVFPSTPLPSTTTSPTGHTVFPNISRITNTDTHCGIRLPPKAIREHTVHSCWPISIQTGVSLQCLLRSSQQVYTCVNCPYHFWNTLQ